VGTRNEPWILLMVGNFRPSERLVVSQEGPCPMELEIGLYLLQNIVANRMTTYRLEYSSVTLVTDCHTFVRF
jgi:hypothetical protein